jgi:hypothetical protein
MVLVNGAEGIGTGWSTYVPNFNPKEIVENLKVGRRFPPSVDYYGMTHVLSYSVQDVLVYPQIC